jgi:hypothetical protein
MKLKNLIPEERVRAHQKLYDAAKDISIEVFGFKPNGRVTWEFTRRWNRNDGSFHFEVPIRIPFYTESEYKNAITQLEPYKNEILDNSDIYYFPKYKVYGKFMWRNKRNDENSYFAIFGSKMLQNMKRDLKQNKITL